MTDDYWVCLDLFCGLGGFSAAFAESDTDDTDGSDRSGGGQ